MPQNKLKAKEQASNSSLPSISSPKKAVFDLMCFILRATPISFHLELAVQIVQMLQLLSYVFNSQHLLIWKDKGLSNVLSALLNYSLIVPLIKDNATMFFILLYVSFAILVINCILFTIGIILLQRNSKQMLPAIRFIFPFHFIVTTVLFLPLLELFSAIFVQDKKTSSIKWVLGLQYTSVIGTVHSGVGGLGVVLLVLSAITLRLIGFEVRPDVNQRNAKSTSRCDVTAIIVKTIVVFCFNFSFIYLGDDQWITAIVIILASSFLLYVNYSIHPYYSQLMTKIDIGLMLIVFWGSIVCFVGKFLSKSGFNGCSELFLVCLPLIAITVYNAHFTSLKHSGLSQMKGAHQFLLEVYDLIHLIENRCVSRTSFLRLYSYMLMEEFDCLEPSCPIKEYLRKRPYTSSIPKTSIDDYYVTGLLYQFIDVLFSRASALISFNTGLHLHYSFFLMSKLGKYDRAYNHLIQACIYSSTLEDEFNSYRIKQAVEENEYNSHHTNNLNKSNANIISYFFHSALFVQLINQTTNMYMDFWSLMIKHSRGDNSFAQLNHMGSEINLLLDLIKAKLKDIEQLKPGDRKTLTLYADFLRSVFHDEEQADKICGALGDGAESFKEIGSDCLKEIDISILGSSSKLQFIVASTEGTAFGKIVHISTEGAALFGYTAKELVNQSIEVLLPEMLNSAHTTFIRNQLTINKPITNNLRVYSFNKAQEDQSDTKLKGKLREVNAFAKTKSHYLIPLKLIVGIMPNERNESVLFAKISLVDYNLDRSCLVLTDSKFLIQYYTANALQILCIKSSFLNERSDITSNIKEFYEEFFTKFTDQQHILKDKQRVKAQIISTTFANPTLITWKEVFTNNDIKAQAKAKDSRRVINVNESLLDAVQLSNSVSAQMRKMTVSKLTIASVLQGYVFKFELPADLIQLPSAWMASHKSNKCNLAQSKNTSLHNTGDIVEKGEIDRNYLPERLNIAFDPVKMSYLFKTDTPQEELTEYMRNKALSKLEHEKAETISLTEEDESGSGSQSLLSEEENEVEEDEEEIEMRKGSSSGEEALKSKKPPTSRQRIDDDYYKVNFTNIKLSIYNYKKKMPIDVKEAFSKDQVQEYIEKEVKSKRNSSIIDALTPELQPNILKQQSKSQGKTPNQTAFISPVTSQRANEFASKRNRKDLAVILLELFLFIAFVVIAVIGFVYFNQMKVMMVQMNSITSVIGMILDLYSYCLYITFYTIEYILINNEKYTNYYFDKAGYKNYTKRFLLLSLDTTLDFINKVYSTHIEMADEAKQQIDNTKCLIKLVNSNYLHNFFNVTLYTALIEGNTAQYNLATATEEDQHLLNKDLQYIFFNLDNSTTRGLNATYYLYFNEQARQIEESKYKLLIILGSIVIVLLLVLGLGRYCLNKVLKLKETYFEVFCRLSEVTIQKALDECEAFSLSFGLNSTNELSKVYSDDLSVLSHQIESTDNRDKEKKAVNKAIDRKEDRALKGDTKEIKRIIAVFWLFNIIILLICAFMVLHTWNYFTRIHDALVIYFFYAQNEAALLRMFQYLKNYIVLGTFEDSYDFDYYSTELKKQLAGIHSEKNIGQALRYSLLNDRRINEEQNANIQKIFSSSLCYLFDRALENELKDSGFDCEAFANNSTSKGFEVVLNQFTDSLQAMDSLTDKRIYEALQTEYYFNEIFYGTFLYDFVPPWDEAEREEYYAINPFNLLNDEYMKEMTMQTLYIIIPAFKYIKLNVIMSYAAEKELYAGTLTLCIVAYFVFLIGVYVVYFIPKENKIKVELNKSKEMLSIIPKDFINDII